MSHNAYIWGVRIYLTSEYTQDEDYGLYTSGGTSELRWIESGVTLSTSPTTWNSDMLLGGGIEAIQQGADLRRRGGRATTDGTVVRVQNATRLAVKLADLSIVLSGLVAEIWEIEHNDQTGEASRSVLFTGSIGRPRWTETELEIPIETADNKRRAQLLTIIQNGEDGNYPYADDTTNGQVIPATFGQIDKAKLIRINNEIELEYNWSMCSVVVPHVPYSQYRFPIVSKTDDLSYTAAIGTGYSGSGSHHTPSTTYLWISVVSGTNAGLSRKVATINSDHIDGAYVVVDFTISDYFPVPLTASADATDADTSWIELKYVYNTYQTDVWPCRAFLDEDMATEITDNLKIYDYTTASTVNTKISSSYAPVISGDINFQSIPKFIHGLIADGNKNAIEIDAKQASDKDVKQFESPLIMPVVGIGLCNSTNMGAWQSSSYVKVVDGIFSSSDVSHLTVTATETPANYDNCTDKSHLSRARHIWKFEFDTTDDADIMHAFKFTPPPPPNGFKFDKAYIIAKVGVAWSKDATDTLLKNPSISWQSRRFTGNAKYAYNSGWKDLHHSGDETNIPDTFTFNSLPDFYTVSQSSNNRYYYTTEHYNGFSGTDAYQYGYQSFEIDIDQVSTQSVHEISMQLRFVIQRYLAKIDPVYLTVDIYELAIAYVRSVGLQDSLYTGYRGRIYNDTWSTRKTAGNLISNPVDAIEHIARLQNWSETGANKNWGKEYTAGALIRTSGEGSFDSTTLSAAGGTNVSLWKQKDLTIAGQILSESEGWTDAALDVFLRMSWMVMYKDAEGYECLRTMVGATSPGTDITLAKIIGRIDPIEEPDPADVFTSPVVRYNYNYGSGKYDGILQVTQPNAAAWSAALTPGLSSSDKNLDGSDTDGEALWTLCHALDARFPQTEPPPSELSDLPMVRDYTTALWYMYQWIKWMGKRRTGFSVPYSIGKSWAIGERINLQLPHQTDNQKIECLVERIVKDKNSGIVSVKVVLLGDLGLA